MRPRYLRLLAALSLLSFVRGQAAGYLFTDLGTGTAVAINNSGVVALNDGTSAFRVQANERQQITNIFLPVVGGPEETVVTTTLTAQAMNDAGHVVGSGWYPSLAGSLGNVGFLNTGDQALPIGFGDGRTAPQGVNNADVFDGSYSDSFGTYGFIAHPGPPLEVNLVPDLNYSELWGINDAGVAVGFGAATLLTGNFPEPYRHSAYRARAFKLVNGAVVYLDPRSPGELPIYHNSNPAVRLSDALAINAAGAVVGNMAVVADGPKHAFRQVGNGMEDLGTLGGETSQANDINDSGVIVGESTVADGAMHAFIYDHGSMVDLNTVLPAGVNAVFTRARAINNQGQIVGEALIGGVTHGVLLSPDALPTPPTITLQPEGTTVALGATVTLSVTTVGALPMTYQWEKDTLPLAGQTANTLVLPNLKGFDTGSYRVVVQNGGGSVISQAANITVLDPQITAVTFAGLALVGEVGAQYRIEFRPQANAGAWTPLETVTLTNSPQWWVDLASVTNPMRLYQAVRLP